MPFLFRNTNTGCTYSSGPWVWSSQMLGLGTGAQRQYKVYWIRSGYRPLPAGDGAPPEAPPEGPAPEAFFYAIWLHLSIKNERLWLI